MNRKILSLLSLIIIVSACTKEIPEAERKQDKNIEQAAVRAAIQNWETAYNSGDLESALDFYEYDYRAMLADSNDISGRDELARDLGQFMKEYPGGKWQINIDEINSAGDLAYVFYTGVFTSDGDPASAGNPLYSERGIKILKKSKIGGWKFFRSMSMPVFSYDR